MLFFCKKNKVNGDQIKQRTLFCFFNYATHFSYNMYDVSEGLADAFSDVEQFPGRCRFSDCKHEREPGCAIRAAIAAGELDVARWESYRKLQEEAADREELMRREQEWSKGVAKFTRQRNKEIW